MNGPRIRSSVSRAQFNRDVSGILGVEVLLCALIAWPFWGGLAAVGILVGLGVLLFTRAAILLVWLFALLWGVLGFAVGQLVFGPVGAVAGALVALCVGFAVNHGGAQYVRDVASDEHMEL